MENHWLQRIALGTCVSALAACSAGAGALTAPSSTQRHAEMMRAVPILTSVCDRSAGPVACSAIERKPAYKLSAGAGAELIEGYHPADLQSAYALPSAGAGFGQTIAIVVPFENPAAEADLAVYRSTFGLPPCTVQNRCFRKVSPPGTPVNVAWAKEMSIDLDVASAVCPNCNLLVVESGSADTTALANAVATAVRMGATVVNNSYASPEAPDAAAANALWNHPGVPIVAGAGDAGYVVNWPAASPFVTAVGGTTLVRDASTPRGWREQVWSNSGSGCSSVLPKPAWQHDAVCTTRSVADVSALADPNPGVAVYDSFAADGWMVFGGTSVSSPIIAGAYALAGNGKAINDASYLYAHAAGALNAISSGYDGPAGLGTPKGVAAF